jgi:tetratricopeptide (TPR) repeat protein
MSRSSEITLADESFSTNPLDVQMQQAWEQVNDGNTASAAELFRGALTLASAELDATSVDLAKVMTDVSTGLFLLGEPYYEESTQLLAQAIEIQSEAEGELNIGCARLHRQLAVMYNARKDFENSASSFGKAMDVFEALAAFGRDVDPVEKKSLYEELRVALRNADAARGEEEGESAAHRLNHCDDRY